LGLEALRSFWDSAKKKEYNYHEILINNSNILKELFEKKYLGLRLA
jgi:hypothetical protein